MCSIGSSHHRDAFLSILIFSTTVGRINCSYSNFSELPHLFYGILAALRFLSVVRSQDFPKEDIEGNLFSVSLAFILFILA